MKTKMHIGAIERTVSAILALIITAALLLPTLPLLATQAEAAVNDDRFSPSNSNFLSGSDFEDLSLGMVINNNVSYSHYVDGVQIYNAYPKNSTITVMAEDGNQFIRIERSAKGKEGDVNNDPYFDFLDTQKNVYTGDFVAEAYFRINTHPNNFANINLLQFINRDNGNYFQSLVDLNKNRKITHLSATEISPKLGEWFHVAAAVHRNSSTTDTMDVYINGICIAKGLKFSKDIASIHQFRVAHMPSSTDLAASMDFDDFRLYKGSAPDLVAESGAGGGELVGTLDFSSPYLTSLTEVKNKLTAPEFEIDPKGNTFTLNRSLGGRPLEMLRTKNRPYLDVFNILTGNASGTLVADVCIQLDKSWNCSADILSPFSGSGSNAVRETFLKINGNKRLTDASGNVLAELGERINRIALVISADRRYATVYVNGNKATEIESSNGSRYTSIDGFRIIEFSGEQGLGNAQIYYADIYRGTAPHATGDNSVCVYHSDLSAGAALPMRTAGSIQSSSGALGYSGNATSESYIRYDSALAVNGLSVSARIRITNAKNTDVLKLGSTPLISLDGSGRLVARSSDGDITLFSPAEKTVDTLTVCIQKGKYTLYLNGLPFVSGVSLPTGVSANTEYLDLLAVNSNMSITAWIDELEIFGGGIPYPVCAPSTAPIAKAENGSAQIFWTELADADGYIVYRSDDGEQAAAVSEVIIGNEYSDTNVIPDVRHGYTVLPVYSVNGTAHPAYTQTEPTFFTLTDPELDAKAASTENGIKLTWNEYRTDNYGYVVYRANKSDGEYTAITHALKTIEYIDTEATPDSIAYYKVCVRIDLGGDKYDFGLKQAPISTLAPDIDTSDGQDSDKDPNGFDIPKPNTVALYENDFTLAPNQLDEIKLHNGITWDQHGAGTNNGALKMEIKNSSAKDSFAALELSHDGTGAIMLDISILIPSRSSDISLFTASNAASPLFSMLKIKHTASGEAQLVMGDGIGGTNKDLASVPTDSWQRITVWINATGDKAAFYLNGICLEAGATLPMTDGKAAIYDMTEMNLIQMSASGIQPLSMSTKASNGVEYILLDNVRAKRTDLFANSFSSLVLSPKVDVRTEENAVTWRTANGALGYTLWRAGADGVYTVIKDGLTTNSYTDQHKETCSYKVTYWFDADGIELCSAAVTTGITATKTPIVTIKEVVSKFFDMSNPGSIGVLLLTVLALGCTLSFVILRKVLKIEPAIPNRIKNERATDNVATDNTSANMTSPPTDSGGNTTDIQ